MTRRDANFSPPRESLPRSAPLLLATSIPPKLSRQNAGARIDDEYQRLCIHSWRECGFDIVSVNHPDEIAILAPLYPGIAFVPAQRNASALSGRKNPYIADLLKPLAAAAVPAVGIVNADIVFQPNPAWLQSLPPLAKDSVIVAQRLDALSLAGGMLERHLWGFDFLMFDPAAARMLIDDSSPFAMGLPWWDYWLPLMLACKGRRLVRVERPAIVHLSHDTAYDPVVWRQLAVTLSRLILDACETAPPPAAVERSRIVPLVREICALSATEAIEQETGDILMQQLASACAGTIGADTIRFDVERANPPALAGKQTELTPANIFDRLEIRASAGEAIIEAKNLQRQGDMRAAEERLQTALRRMPDDTDALFYYGEFAFRQRDLRQAALLFSKLVKLRPDFCNAINTFGAVLEGMGQFDDAIACYERALQIDPEYAAAYVNLALALRRAGRHEEAVRRFQRLLAEKPNFSTAVEYYYHLQQRLRALGGRPIPQEDIYFSAEGEDAVLDEFFGFRSAGCFVDLGAGDGIHFSNSYVFEKRGWSGICVEPAPDTYALLAANRPHSRCANTALDDRPAIGELLEAAGEIDFLTLDAKAGGLSTVAALDLERHTPRVLLMSWNASAERSILDAHLQARGYQLARSRGESHFYVRNEEDRAALRSISVSAKLAPAAVPLRKQYVYWPAEQ